MADAAKRLSELCSRFRLSDRQGRQLEEVLAVLSGDVDAPTAVRSPELAVNVHLADSLVALDLGALSSAEEIVDIGAGAGFPGLPLAVALPSCRFTLIDSHARKCGFIERLIASADIFNAEVVCARVEQWATGIGVHDAALARAVASQPVVVEYAAPLLRLGGTLVDWRGRRDASEEEAGLRAAAELGMERQRVMRSEPFVGARDHHLHVFVKAADTPGRYPRRVGMARKRPLG